MKNVAAFSTLMTKVVERQRHLPGMACFSGYSGYGKSRSAVYGAGKYRAAYVELEQYTTAKSMMQMILAELGINRPKGSVPELISQAIEIMAGDVYRPLIVDEAHYIASKKFVDVLRTLHDKSGAPVILIGEETLPKQLEAFERVHNRMLTWVQAVPLDAEDFAILARTVCPSIKIASDLAAAILQETSGNTRRIIVNFDEAEQRAKRLGTESLDLKAFMTFGPIIGNKAPLPRAY
ncbi:AAA family ATPase [Devosia sediminis]|uniref:AAA family ATPase n=1 Tax=Devosia sediminis TaxID=2798801 RepID=UPI001F1D4043|nr:ATP-binding protein [Devosia sediminis]